MPTTRPRYTLTESDQLAAALADAARVWPEHAASRPQLLLDLVEEGHRAIAEHADKRRATRLAALRDARRAFTGTYEAGYLDQLRSEWPD